MAQYRVTKPWWGVKKGQIVELDSVPRSIKGQVELIDEGEPEKDAELTVNPKKSGPKNGQKAADKDASKS